MAEFCYETYPLTIVADRYNGAYSGGAYTAWNCEPHDIPFDIFGDDVTCAQYWDYVRAEKLSFVGVGGSPREAALDLYIKRAKWLKKEDNNG